MKGPIELLIDIETAPKEVLTWGVYDQNIAPNQLVKDTSVLSWSAKIKGKNYIYGESNKDSKDPRNDKKLLKGIYSLINEADIVVGHNGDKFDMKQLKTRFIKHGMEPIRKPKTYDTLKIARREFGFTFNKLEYLADFLELPIRKLVDRQYQGFNLWTACLAHDPKAWKEMLVYNKRDVEVLELVWEKLSPWAGINHSVFNDGKEMCSCGSTDFVSNGLGVSGKTMYQRRRCTRCGNEIKGKKS